MRERCKTDLGHNGFNCISCGILPGSEVVNIPLVVLVSHSIGDLVMHGRNMFHFHVYFVCKFLRDQQDGRFSYTTSHGKYSIYS